MAPRQLTPLSPCVLPSRFASRDAPAGLAGWDAPAQTAFDANTLFYDVFQTAAPGMIHAVGPPLKKTLRTFIKQADLRINGAEATLRETSQTKRACSLEISADVHDAHTLTILHPKLSVNISISPSALPRYAGLDTMFTLSRNNTLDWVRDWARYHVDTHGVEGILLYDNASDLYGADALSDVLAGIGGLKAFDVVPAPFQYGPAGLSREVTSTRYLQFALFEVTRLRFLQQAAGALNMDIDEMAYAPAGRTVFDAARDSDQGFLTLPGSWRYPQPGAPLLHGSHILRAAGPEEPMYPKWCLVPGGPLRGKSWRTHGIKGLPDQVQDGHGFLHCRMISESWHYDRSEYTGLALEPDPLAIKALGPALGAQ
ncbi:hypothetical protein [Roseovarius dicentrarchi]|uniref:hypothetical protein n=1 Tax=Roseovarius dicentrarchi TaxID=2250573 RepID=UPI000DEB6442|nr:hypothetical protein [Roseovarius dicentrarchi]